MYISRSRMYISRSGRVESWMFASEKQFSCNVVCLGRYRGGIHYHLIWVLTVYWIWQCILTRSVYVLIGHESVYYTTLILKWDPVISP